MSSAPKTTNWLDQRTGYKRLLRSALMENIPGGSRWRYVWGSTLAFTLAVQFITGVFLWLAYNPSSLTAWESVYYIQYEMWGGWLVRGVHHFTAQAMVVLLVLHLMQVVIDGAYKAPREVNFWFGIGLLLLVLGLGLTGYLLPWDQKGYWATKVATNLVALFPFIGPELQQLLVGGTDYGHHTLSRFFALHAGVLPGLILLLLTGHIYLFRRHGITAKEPLRKRDEKFWPDQLLKDAVACLAVLGAVLFLVVQPQLFGEGQPGAHLGPPADPSVPFSAARPEWYFLFLYQFLKPAYTEKLEFLPINTEVLCAIYIPMATLAVIALFPFIGRWKLGHRFNLVFLSTLLGAAVLLTYLARADDAGNPTYQAAVQRADKAAKRAFELAQSPAGIPPEGAAYMLQKDPFLQAPQLFAQHCASCHRYNGHNGLGESPSENPSASDLHGFASRSWIRGLLDPERVDSVHYFGATDFAGGKMVEFVQEDVAEFMSKEPGNIEKVATALSAEASLPYQQEADLSDQQTIEEGRQLMREVLDCTDCHQFRQPDDLADAPDLTGYGSRDWLIAFISNPAHSRFYGEDNDRMPLFGEDQILDEESIALIADWLRKDWYRPETASSK